MIYGIAGCRGGESEHGGGYSGDHTLYKREAKGRQGGVVVNLDNSVEGPTRKYSAGEKKVQKGFSRKRLEDSADTLASD